MARTATRPGVAEQAVVTDLAASVAHWTDEIADLERLLVDHDSSVGRRVLDDEATADQLATERADIDGRLRTAAAARDEAQRRLEQARKAAVLAVADDLDARANAEERTLDQHKAKVQKLLDQLEELERWRYVPEGMDVATARAAGSDKIGAQHGDVTMPARVTTALGHPVGQLRKRAEQVRERAVDGMTADTYAEALVFAENRLAEVEPQPAPAAA